MNCFKSTSPGNPDRRSFIKHLSLGAAGVMVLPSFNADKSPFVHKTLFEKLRSSEPIDEDYWEMIKKQFTIAPDLMMVNSANLCPCPYFVNEAVMFYTRELAKDVSFQHRGQFGQKRKESLNAFSNYLNVSSADLGITRNTSESNNIVVNGLDLSPDDEIIIWDQNHPSNHVTWQHRARRYGFTVKFVSVPDFPRSQEDLIQPFRDAITANTRLISFSHISNVSGIALPARELCQLAQQDGIMTLVDGAQSVGFLNLDLTHMGCSFYTASTHKWLMGPMENGLLYVHSDFQEEIWPNIIAAGWNSESKTIDEKLCALGQRNTPSTSALPEIIGFHEIIGKQRIEDRIRKLNTRLKDGLKTELPDIEFVTPVEENLSGGVTIFNIPGADPVQIFQKLYEEHGIAAAPTGGVRISPTINTTLRDIDRIIESIKKVVMG